SLSGADGYQFAPAPKERAELAEAAGSAKAEKTSSSTSRALARATSSHAPAADGVTFPARSIVPPRTHRPVACQPRFVASTLFAARRRSWRDTRSSAFA